MVKIGKSRVRNAAVALTMVAIPVGCANERGPHPGLPPLGVSVDFLSQNLCGEGISPEIRLGGVPKDTAYYRLRITNISILMAPRWEATIKAGTPLLPEGAISDFQAPCPGELQVFNYRLEVLAHSVDDRPLAYGWSFASARSLTKQILLEQVELKRNPTDRSDRTKFPSPQRPAFFIQ